MLCEILSGFRVKPANFEAYSTIQNYVFEIFSRLLDINQIGNFFRDHRH